MRVKGLIFTIDALFSLALFSVVALSFAAFFQYTPYLQHLSQLHSLGHDYSVVNQQGYSLSTSEFRDLTGLKIVTSKAEIPPQAHIVVHTIYYSYPRLCGATSSNEHDPGSRSCFSSQESASGQYKYETWVHLP